MELKDDFYNAPGSDLVKFTVKSDGRPDEDNVGNAGDEEFEELKKRLEEAKKILSEFSNKKYHSDRDILQKKRGEFMLKGGCLAARYFTVRDGALLTDAIWEEFGLPQEFTESYDRDAELRVNLNNVRLYDPELAGKLLRWLYENFYECKDFGGMRFGLIMKDLLSTSGFPVKDQSRKMYSVIRRERELIAEIMKSDCIDGKWFSDTMFYAVNVGDRDTTILFAKALAENDGIKIMTKINAFEKLAYFCSRDKKGAAARFYLINLFPVVKRLENRVSSAAITKIAEMLKKSANEEKTEPKSKTGVEKTPSEDIKKESDEMKNQDSPVFIAIYADESSKKNYEDIRAFLKQKYPSLKFLEKIGRFSVSLKNEKTSAELRFSLIDGRTEFMMFLNGVIRINKKLVGEISLADIGSLLNTAILKAGKEKKHELKTIGEETGLDKDVFADLSVDELVKFGCSCAEELKRANIRTVADVLDRTEKGLTDIRGIGTAKGKTVKNSLLKMRAFLDKYSKGCKSKV